jgi:hypothetical protein
MAFAACLMISSIPLGVAMRIFSQVMIILILAIDYWLDMCIDAAVLLFKIILEPFQKKE